MKLLNEEDIRMHKGLMALLDKATYPMKAEDVQAFIKIYTWAKELPTREAPMPKKEGLSK